MERPRATAVRTTGYDWLFEVESGDTGTVVLAGDSLHYAGDSARTTFTLTGAGDTLRFDLEAVARAVSDSSADRPAWNDSAFVIPAASQRFRECWRSGRCIGTDPTGWPAGRVSAPGAAVERREVPLQPLELRRIVVDDVRLVGVMIGVVLMIRFRQIDPFSGFT